MASTKVLFSQLNRKKSYSRKTRSQSSLSWTHQLVEIATHKNQGLITLAEISNLLMMVISSRLSKLILADTE